MATCPRGLEGVPVFHLAPPFSAQGVTTYPSALQCTWATGDGFRGCSANSECATCPQNGAKGAQIPPECAEQCSDTPRMRLKVSKYLQNVPEPPQKMPPLQSSHKATPGLVLVVGVAGAVLREVSAVYCGASRRTVVPPRGQWGTIVIHEHRVSLYRPSTPCSTLTTLCTRVGTGFHCTVLVTAHSPVLKTGIVIVRSVPSALAPGLK